MLVPVLALSNPSTWSFSLCGGLVVIWDIGGGWNAKHLHRIGFVDGADKAAFGFLDPKEVIRGIHLVPAFHYGWTRDLLPPSCIARPGRDNDEDWQFFYVNQ